jgi:cell division initiation protein
MRITPMDIRKQQFTLKLFRGFDVQEVDAFLDDVADDYEKVVKENMLLKEQLNALEERLKGVEEREKLLQETLVTTQRVAEEMKESARREAKLLVREAELQGDKLLEEARADEAKLRREISSLKRLRRQLAEEIKGTVEMYQRLIAQELKESDEGAGAS